MQRGGRLSRQELLCAAAATSGQLEELKELRKNDTPWDALTCTAAAKGGHLNVLLWARANGYPRDDDELLYTAAQFALEVMCRR